MYIMFVMTALHFFCTECAEQRKTCLQAGEKLQMIRSPKGAEFKFATFIDLVPTHEYIRVVLTIRRMNSAVRPKIKLKEMTTIKYILL